MKQKQKVKVKSKKSQFGKGIFYLLPFIFSLVVACGGNSSQNQQPQTTASPQADESGFTITNFILNEADKNGKPVWRIRAKQAKYTREQKVGLADNPYGELYQDGKVVYQLTAQQAEIEKDGKLLFLRGKIVATDPNNGIVLRGNEVEWRPDENLMIIRNQLTGAHKQLNAVAKEARVKTKEEIIDFYGGVVAHSLEQQVQMRTERLTWLVKQEKLIGDRPVQFDRYQNNQVTDRGRGDSGEFNLKTKIATINRNAQVELQSPPLSIASNAMTWDLNTEVINTNAPVRVVHRQENATVNGDRGRLNIAQKMVYLTGNVNAVGEKRQTLQANSVNWNLNTQQVEAQGNVVYKQVDPQPLTFRGAKAVGNLSDQNVAVTGGDSGGKVFTEIIPQDKFLNPRSRN